MEDMLKADFDFYANTYKGKETEETIGDLLDKASAQVFTATQCRTKSTKLTPFQREMTKMAICEQAEYLNKTEEAGELEGVTGYTIGDVSISFDASKSSNNSGVCEKARAYLLPTGLLNRCLF